MNTKSRIALGPLLLLLAMAVGGCGAGGGGGGAGGTEGGTVVIPRSSVAKQEAVPPGEECPAGGQRIYYGIDDNSNGALDPEEIDGSVVICNGTTSLVNVVDEPPGANCQFGGLRIETGPDANGNGSLDPDEVKDTDWICTPGPGENEGTTSPVQIAFDNQVPGRVAALGQSFYLINIPSTYGLNDSFKMTLSREDSDLDLVITTAFDGGQVQNPQVGSCGSGAPDAEWCTYTLSGTVSYQLQLTEPDGIPNLFYMTMSHEPKDQGTVGSPLRLSCSGHTECASGVEVKTVSYFTMQAPSNYSELSDALTLTVLAGDADLYVYDSPGFAGQDLVCQSTTTGTTSEACTLFPGQTTMDYYVKLVNQGTNGIKGVLSVIKSATDDVVSEGTVGSPMDIGTVPPVAYVGAVIGADSYYKIGVVPSAPITVRLTALTGTADLRVYRDAAFSKLLCASTNGGLAEENCSVVTPYATLYMKVSPVSGSNANFVLSVRSP